MRIASGRKNVAHIYTRFYRTPKLIRGRGLYGPAVAIWEYSCALAELAVGCPFFIGEAITEKTLAT